MIQNIFYKASNLQNSDDNNNDNIDPIQLLEQILQSVSNEIISVNNELQIVLAKDKGTAGLSNKVGVRLLLFENDLVVLRNLKTYILLSTVLIVM